MSLHAIHNTQVSNETILFAGKREVGKSCNPLILYTGCELCHSTENRCEFCHPTEKTCQYGKCTITYLSELGYKKTKKSQVNSFISPVRSSSGYPGLFHTHSLKFSAFIYISLHFLYISLHFTFYTLELFDGAYCRPLGAIFYFEAAFNDYGV